MNQLLNAVTVNGRAATTKKSIADAVTTVLADHGTSGLTHRRIAQIAQKSLSVTTYHFATKHDILAEAARGLLDDYIADFQKVLVGIRSGKRSYPDLNAFEARLVENAITRNRKQVLAWNEIILAAARDDALKDITVPWFAKLQSIWQELAVELGLPNSPGVARMAIDRVVGAQLMALALNFSVENKHSLVRDGTAYVEACRTSNSVVTARAREGKAAIVQEAIRKAAIDLLIQSGARAVTYRAVAEVAGVTHSAPAYYFGSISGLLAAAQTELFRAAKDRYRAGFASHGAESVSLLGLADATTAIFAREATEFSLSSTAHYSVWLEAARSDQLRHLIRISVHDQNLAWQRRLAGFGNVGIAAAVSLQAHFIGRLLRVVATGSRTADLADARPDFLAALERVTGK
ncbi:TetR/AcrR family transcriptional regulator [Methylobacterium aquaticum]|uniref:TetR/AcrR family transcriptional regulator n=1 Tax=Methylobacterium aquaticum TaxID=270351 RepID=UPI003D16B3D8